jgi:hypothetical protein
MSRVEKGFLTSLACPLSQESSKVDARRFTPNLDSAINSDVSTQELIIKEIQDLPESLQREVYDFARFLREKSSDESFNGLLVSKSALKKDWDTPEEDAAWANL